MRPRTPRSGRRSLLLPLLALALLLGIGVLSQSHAPVQAGTSGPVPIADDGDRFATQGDLILQPGDVVEHDAWALDGKVVVPTGATVKHDVVTQHGAIEIAGTVGHDVRAIGGDVTLASTAVVGNDVTVTGGQVRAESGSHIGGKTSVTAAQEAPRDHSGGPLGFIVGVLTNLVLVVVFVAVGTLVVLAWPRRTGQVVTTLEHAPLAAAAVGLLTAVLIIPVAILLSGILFITIIGIILIPFLWLALLVAWFYGLIVAGLWAGRRLADSGRVTAAQGSLLVTAAAGMVLVAGLPLLLGALVPWLGWTLLYFIGFLGLGAGLIHRFSGGVSLPRLGGHGPASNTQPLQAPPPDRRAS